MKAQSIGNKYERGSGILEIIIAVAILTLGISAATLLSFANQTLKTDTSTSGEALYKAKSVLENARASSTSDFMGIVSTTTTDGIYTKKLTVSDLTPCRKEVTSAITWQLGARPQKIALTTDLADIAGTLAMGGDCITDPPGSTWDSPDWFAKDTFGPKPTAIDVLHKIAYLGLDNNPFFYIADARTATLGQTSFSPGTAFVNGFDAGAQINMLDVIEWRNPSTGAVKTYVFSAMDTTTNQLQVIDVTDIYNPVLVATATRSLNDLAIPLAQRVDPAGSNPQGKTIYYYNNKIYIGLSRTAGPELHIFDVSTPTNPIWLGSREMNHNINAIAAQGNYAYLAMTVSDSNDKELAILNVSNPASITPPFVFGAPELWGYNANGTEDGLTEFVAGNKLYLGRAKGSASEPELLVLDITNPTASIPRLAPGYIGDGVTDIYIAGRFCFIATDHPSTDEFQVWDISSYPISLIKKYNFGNGLSAGFDYEPDVVYTTGQSTPNFQILYSIPPFIFSLANSGDIAVTQGASGINTITSALISGTTANVTLSVSGLPAGANATFNNNPCSPTCSSVLTIATTFPTTPAGTYPITVSAGGKTTIFNLVVNVQPFDYTLSNSGNITVTQGSSGNNTITRTLVSGATSGITLSTSSLPAGATATFTANPCSPTCSSTLTISTTLSTPTGTYPITVTGSPNGTSNPSTTFSLTVNAPFDYALTNSGDITMGKNQTNTSEIITRALVSGVSTGITLTASGYPTSPPNNTTMTFSLNPCTPNPTCSSTVTIKTKNNTPLGTYIITMTGAPNGTGVRTTTFTLKIQ